MEIFEAHSEEDVEMAHPIDATDFESLNVKINGRPQAATWAPVSMEIIRVDEGRALREADSPWLGSHALILRRSAVEAMNEMFLKNGEILPLRCPTDELFVFNPTNLIECFDEEASDVVRFTNCRIMRIRRHVFRMDRLLDIDAFKIPNLRVSPTYVTDSFVGRWSRIGLTGIRWKRVA